MNDNKSKITIAIFALAMLGFVVLVWNAPESFWTAMRDQMPQEHYENGQRIRTIRGQDFIVTGYGDTEHLVPLAPEGTQNTIVIVKTNYVRVEQ